MLQRAVGGDFLLILRSVVVPSPSSDRCPLASLPRKLTSILQYDARCTAMRAAQTFAGLRMERSQPLPYAASARRRRGSGSGFGVASSGEASAASSASRNCASLRSFSIFSPNTSFT